MKRVPRFALGLFLLIAGTHTAFGVPINDEQAFSFRETRFNAPGNFTQGDIFQVGISLAETSVLPDTPVTITNSNTGEVFVATEGVNSTTGRLTFYSNIQYSESRASGDWQFAASNDGGQLTVSRPAFGLGPGTGSLPGVENLAVSGLSAAPVLSWDLPDDLASLNDGNVDRLRVRVQDDEGTVFDSRADMGLSLSLEETSFQVPFGYLEDEGTYYAQVLCNYPKPWSTSP